MNLLRRLAVISLVLATDVIAHAEPRRLVITVPEYPEGPMPDKEKVMSTLASYALWPAQDRPVAPSQLFAEYARYCKARWALTAWNLRASPYLDRFTKAHQEMHAWSECLAPVANSRRGCVSGFYLREYWANEMRLEDALAYAATFVPEPGKPDYGVDQGTLDRVERMVWEIMPLEHAPGRSTDDDAANVKDFAEHKYRLVKATQRLNAALKELPATATSVLLEDIRRTLSTLKD
jgi:hypothetical protein